MSKSGKEGEEKVREDIEETHANFDQLKARRDKLYNIYQEVINEMNAKLEELNSALIFL